MQLADLTRKSKELLEAIRGREGFEEGLTNLLTDLYPDNAHFIYELLQNAEDKKANTIRFRLSNEAIQFEHNGKESFDLKDVESITNLGKTTKRNDPTAIGKFGVGFKAVFAYTNTPEIHSGDFHFRIKNLFIPEELPNTGYNGATDFHFPFDNPKKSSARAVEEIERGLRALADNTLLFLNHIREIKYLLPNGDSGELRRGVGEGQGIGQCIEIHAIHPGQAEAVSKWMRYRKEVFVTDEAGKTKARQVAIAFRLELKTDDSASGQDGEKKSQRRVTKPKGEWSIVPCEPGRVSIFFPAENAKSGLRFHLHAPFASTVARDCVPDCDANNALRDALAQLTAEALADIRARGMLTMSFLAILPNEDDGLTPFYQPIREAIIKAFKDQDLVPTKSGSHLKAAGLYRGPSDISSVIDDDDLSLLTDCSPPLWAANAPQKGQREDKFLDSLGVEEWGWRALTDIFTRTEQDKDKRKRIEKWLSKKPDNWLMRFYALMESCHGKVAPIDRVRLVSAWDSLDGIRAIGSKDSVKHVTPSAAYFPQSDESAKMPVTVRRVKPEVYEKGRLGDSIKKAARDFLKCIGVQEYDEQAQIERRLKRYSKPGDKILSESHYSDIRAFEDFLKNNRWKNSLFKEVGFLAVAGDEQNQLLWVKPEDVFLDAPYETTGLGNLAAIHKKRKLWPDYVEHLGRNISREDFVSFLKNVGVMHRFEITKASVQQNGKIETRRPRYRMDKTEIDKDWIIQDIEKYLAARNQAVSCMIWHAIIQADSEVATAEYRRNQQYDLITVESQLVQYLRSCAWIPDKLGVFHRPQDMTQEMLPTEFPYDDRNGLLTAIEFEKTSKEASEEFKRSDANAKNAGFESANELQEARDLLKAKREGRIREVSKEIIEPSDEAVQAGRSYDAGESQPASVGANVPNTPQDGKMNQSPVRQRINDRIDKSKITSVPMENDGEQQEQLGDNDDYTPVSVDYRRKIDRAEKRNATEIANLEREEELLNRAIGLPRYSYGWFLALLELEGLASGEKNADGKTVSISFGRIEKDGVSSRTLILKEPNRYIPQTVEELFDVRVDLDFDDGRAGKFYIESFTAKEFMLYGKLKSVDELNGIDLGKVVEARIEIKNPDFLLQALLKCFHELRLEEKFNMKANLTPNIEFVFGPPGTGKTTHLAEKVLIPLMSGTENVNVLVLTPTNKAADVLTTRIMDKMGADTAYQDWLVRFGSSADDRIEKEGIWRDRSFDIRALDRSVTVTTIARFAYDGFAAEGARLNEMKWNVIVIDEASMIPLVYIIYPLFQQKPRRFVIAGDPFQIEPIVTIEQWKGENIYTLVGLNKPGAFARPQAEPHVYPVTNLETQYRSVPAIGEVFSHFTYSGILKHHRTADARRPLKVDGIDIKPLNLIKFPVSKFESIYRAKRLKSGTPYQTYSALFTFEFVRWLAKQIQKNHEGEAPFRIGIIAPYRAQANLLSKLNDSRLAALGGVEIQVGTIHGFQGDECDIIIAVFNPPPTISKSPQMFLNKQNILNVAISRARDYLIIIMPDKETDGVQDLRKLANIEGLVRNSGAFSEYDSHVVEEKILGNAQHLEKNTFSTGHQMVNVYLKPERYYEVRSDESAIDVQIHEK